LKRVRKCIEGPFDALVLAEAGLKRLHVNSQALGFFLSWQKLFIGMIILLILRNVNTNRSFRR
jgi:hypothetical protein